MQDDSTTTTTTVDESTTTTTTEAKSIAQQYADGSLPNPDPAHAAPSTDLSASGSVASPAVSNPANDPTTNDTTQTQEERLADARYTAMTNHAADLRTNGSPAQENSKEEEVA